MPALPTGANANFLKYEKKFDLGVIFTMPRGQWREYLHRSMSGSRSNKDATTAEQEKAIKSMTQLINRMVKKLDQYDGKTCGLTLSTGGTKSETGEDVIPEEAGNVTKYWGVEINDVIIMEALNQYGNATYIFKKSDDIAELLKMSRRDIMDSGMAVRVRHEGDNKQYNFENDHILTIMDAVALAPESVLALTSKNIVSIADIRAIVENATPTVKGVVTEMALNRRKCKRNGGAEQGGATLGNLPLELK